MPEAVGTKPSQPVVQSVARALELLEAVAARDEIGLAALGRETGLQPGTAHRLLATLIESGYIVQNKRTGPYRLSHKVVALAGGPELRVARLRAIARPHLEAIRDQSDETTNLVVLERFTATYIDQVESPRAIRLFAQVGRRVVAHATGGGKAMLAYQPDEIQGDLLAAAPYQGLTPNTITSATAMRREFDRIRARGYATEQGEYEPDVGCVGVPVLDGTGHAIAAISVSAPLGRLQELDLVELAAFMTVHSREMSEELG